MIQKLLFLFVFLPFLVIKADPREAEASEFQEFYPNELEEKLTRGLDQADMTIKFQLEHDLPLSSKDDVTFTNRGLVEIELSSTNMKPKVSFSQVPSLSKEQIDTLEKRLGRNGLYTIRARSDPSNPTSPYVSTSIPLCLLAGTHFREDLSFHLTDAGKLFAIEYRTPYPGVQSCTKYQKMKLNVEDFKEITSFGNAVKAQNGPAPPKQIAAKKAQAPKGIKPTKSEEDKNPEENQSFFRKYWYIILPIVVLSLFGGEPPPQNAGSAAGGGAGGSSGGARRK